MLMKPLKEGWVIITRTNLEDEVNSVLFEAIGIYTDKEKATQVASDLMKALNVEAWVEPTPIDTMPLRFRIDDIHKISGRGTVFAGDLVLGSPNDVELGMVLHHHAAGKLKIVGVERIGRSLRIGLIVSGWETWDKEQKVEGLICSIKEKA